MAPEVQKEKEKSDCLVSTIRVKVVKISFELQVFLTCGGETENKQGGYLDKFMHFKGSFSHPQSFLNPFICV